MLTNYQADLTAKGSAPTLRIAGFKPRVMNCITFDVLTNSETVRESLENNQQATGVGLLLLPAEPVIELKRLGRNEHPVCSLMARTNDGDKACLEFHAKLHNLVVEGHVSHQAQCHAGLVHVAVPIVVNGCHAATLIGGRVFAKGFQRKAVRHIAGRLRQCRVKHDLQEITTACSKTGALSKGQLDTTTQTLVACGRLFAATMHIESRDARRDEPSVAATARRFIEEHFAANITARDVARHVCLNKDHLERVFKQATGKSMIHYLADIRVEQVKVLITQGRLSVKQAAAKTGFHSVRQLQRAFKSRANVSPTKYRSQKPAIDA